ncbi:MAG: ABC transporter ATP-binding protein [Gemmatimonadaceae bacterium]|nr:ABC transporter ATP-binding protein [Gemmatimonadaceae bacterium]
MSTIHADAPAIRLADVRFGYRPGQQVLDIPALEIARGARVFLYGPSGSGKTTLLGLIAGVLAGGTGRVEVLGTDLARLGGSARDAFRAQHLGYIFQMFNLIPYLSVRDNILLPTRLDAQRAARLRGQSPAQAATELAEGLDILSLLDQPVTELSVGQQQRVAAARALIGYPELVVADEPTSALDADRREAFLRLLFASCERVGATLVFVSHDQALAPLFSQRVSLPDINRAARPAAA